jgi:hypothetical protein
MFLISSGILFDHQAKTILLSLYGKKRWVTTDNQQYLASSLLSLGEIRTF